MLIYFITILKVYEYKYDNIIKYYYRGLNLKNRLGNWYCGVSSIFRMSSALQDSSGNTLEAKLVSSP